MDNKRKTTGETDEMETQDSKGKKYQNIVFTTANR